MEVTSASAAFDPYKALRDLPVSAGYRQDIDDVESEDYSLFTSNDSSESKRTSKSFEQTLKDIVDQQIEAMDKLNAQSPASGVLASSSLVQRNASGFIKMEDNGYGLNS
jgi:hypothetical protein